MISIIECRKNYVTRCYEKSTQPIERVLDDLYTIEREAPYKHEMSIYGYGLSDESIDPILYALSVKDSYFRTVDMRYNNISCISYIVDMMAANSNIQRLLLSYNSNISEYDIPHEMSKRIVVFNDNNILYYDDMYNDQYTIKHANHNNILFDNRRSSSKSDIETARFNKVDGLTSSRYYDNNSNNKQVQNITLDKKNNVQNDSNNNNLINTFSTIKNNDNAYDNHNNSSSKYNNHNILIQLNNNNTNSSHESFEFTKCNNINMIDSSKENKVPEGNGMHLNRDEVSIIDTIKDIIQSLNNNIDSYSQEDRFILECINSLHVFEFNNACVIGLDIKDHKNTNGISESVLLGSPAFIKLLSYIGILRVKNSSINHTYLNKMTHANLILLSINMCSLTSLAPVHNIQSLKLLNISDNHIGSLAGVEQCTHLSELYANNNRISSLQELKNIKHLKILSVAYNTISDVSEFQYLRRHLHLSYVRIIGNPLCVNRQYSSLILNILPKIVSIDNFYIDVSDFKDFHLLWKDKHSIQITHLKADSSTSRLAHHNTNGNDTGRTGSKSAKRLKSSVRSKREKTRSGIPEESLESYGFSKQKDSVKKISLSKLLLNRQESAPFLLRDKLSQICSKKVLTSARSKRVAGRDKSAPGDKTKKGHSKSIAGKKLVF